MRMSLRGVFVMSLAAAALMVSGCSTPDTIVVPIPKPSATPLFATDEEALAAAEEAYAAYQHVSDAILIDGGLGSERLKKVADERIFEQELAGFEQAYAEGLHSTGGSTFDGLRIQRLETTNVDFLSVYLCEDVTAVDIVNAQGQSIVMPSRVNRYPLVVSFRRGTGSQRSIVVSQIDDWTGENFC